MHEMGQRFKCCSRKAPFVLTECEIAHSVCVWGDCEWRVGLREDHLLTFNEESETVDSLAFMWPGRPSGQL